MLLELNNISLQQGGFNLRVSHLSLQSKRLYVLRGENGTGKSTLLRLMALLQQPQAGQVRFAGQPVCWRGRGVARLRQRVTLLDQTPFLFCGSVETNLAFGLKLRGLTGSQLRRRIDEALEIVDLKDFGQRSAAELSGGEVRRVALARALCLYPQLLLLDEPTAYLDVRQLASFELFLARLPEQGISIVMATHDAKQSQRLGGEIIDVRDGLVRQLNQVPPKSGCQVVQAGA